MAAPTQNMRLQSSSIPIFLIVPLGGQLLNVYNRGILELDATLAQNGQNRPWRSGSWWINWGGHLARLSRKLVLVVMVTSRRHLVDNLVILRDWGLLYTQGCN
jgi:hypothetical protein